MKMEEEKIRQILKRGMQQPSPGFSMRVMHQIARTQTAPQPSLQIKALKPLASAFGLIALLAIGISLVLEGDFISIQEELLSYLSTQQMINFIFSLLSFWVLMLLSPWIKKQIYYLSGA